MKPRTIDKIVASLVTAIACGSILLTINTCSSIAVKAAEPCSMTEQKATANLPKGTSVFYGSKRAFTILYNRFNTQRQSVGYGPIKADRIVVLLFMDTSVGVFMSRDGCMIKETLAHLKWDNWVGVMEDLKLTPRDFTPGKLPQKEISL